MYSDIYRPISFKLGMMIETTKLYILKLCDLGLHSRSQLYKQLKTGVYFLENFAFDLDEIQHVAATT